MTAPLKQRTLVGMLQFNGRPVSWFGVGAPDVVGPGIAALVAVAQQYASPRITNPQKAVADLQAAGSEAVRVVGPAIDALSGGHPDVMRLTQLAWQKNGQLAGVNSSGATGSDVETAKGIVGEMITSYQQAAKLAASIAPKASAGSAQTQKPGGSSAMTPPVPDAPPSGGFLDWLSANKIAVIVSGAAVVVGGGLVVAATVPRRRAA